MSMNILNDISSVYLKQVVGEGVRPGEVAAPLDKTAFKKRRRSLAGKEKSAEARSRGHEGKTWADLTEKEKKEAQAKYRFDPMRPGVYQGITGFGNMM